MHDDTLMLLADEVRTGTLNLLTGMGEPLARFTVAGLHNTILWHAGHMFVVMETLAMAFTTGTVPQYPDGWFEKFSWDSNPATVTQWPPIAEVVEQLTAQKVRLLDLIKTLSPEQLAKEVGDAQYRQSARHMIVHALHDEASHQGEIYLLMKMWKQGKITPEDQINVGGKL